MVQALLVVSLFDLSIAQVVAFIPSLRFAVDYNYWNDKKGITYYAMAIVWLNEHYQSERSEHWEWIAEHTLQVNYA